MKSNEPSGESCITPPAARTQEVIERAYGCLWRETGDAGLFVFRARKLLLSLLDKEAQKRGIAWALEQFGEPPPEQAMDVIGPPRGAHAETGTSERTGRTSA